MQSETAQGCCSRHFSASGLLAMTTVRGPVTVYVNPFGVSSLSSNGSQRSADRSSRDRHGSPFVEASLRIP